MTLRLRWLPRVLLALFLLAGSRASAQPAADPAATNQPAPAQSPEVHSGGLWEPKTVTLDHPLDPENKLIRFALIQAPAAWTVYSGTALLNGKGEATIRLPVYFELANKNPQYLLTPIGTSMPNLHIKAEIRDNVFVIGGGAPKGKVCWEIKGERNDQAIQNHPLVIEDNKTQPGLLYRPGE